MEASNVLFRCSSLGHIMADGNSITELQLAKIAELEAKEKRTEKQEAELSKLIEKRDNPELQKGVKTHLVDVFASYKYGRKEEVSNKYLTKGNAREEDSITLVSRVTKTFYKKNDVRLRNAFIQGEPDIYVGESIESAEHILDTKTAWSLHTFMRAKYSELDPLYYWQGIGYMDLTGAKSHTVCFCLVNATAEIILMEKDQLKRRMKITDETDSFYKEKCRQIEINHIFDIKAFMNEYPGFPFDNDVDKWKWDIPLEERLHTISFERNESDIRKMHDRVLQCREYMEKTFFTQLVQEEANV